MFKAGFFVISNKSAALVSFFKLLQGHIDCLASNTFGSSHVNGLQFIIIIAEFRILHVDT